MNSNLEQLEELKEIINELTPGQWVVGDECVETTDGKIIAATNPDDNKTMHQIKMDTEFIVMARYKLPQLIEEYKKLQARHDEHLKT